MAVVQWWQQALPRWARLVLVEIFTIVVTAVAAAWGVPPHPWSLPVALVASALLPLRHLRPELAVLGVLPALAGGLGWPAAVVALYALGRRTGRSPWLWFWMSAVVLTVFGTVALTEDLPWQRLTLTFAITALITGGPAVLGMLMTTRARLTASLRELEQARESAVAASREAARAQERARIGREIHDAVGHHATLIAIGAAALSASTKDESTRQAAEQIRTLAKRALAEMRAALGLVDGCPEQDGGPTEIAALVEGARAAGVDVELAEHGEPVELAPVVERAVYRVVQESLTNAARHAPGQPVRVALQWGTKELQVRANNPLPTRRPAPDPIGGGTGLTGLTERVTLLGGRLDAGVADADTFTVTATFPLTSGRSPATSEPQPPTRTSSPPPQTLPTSTHESRLDGATIGGGAAAARR